MFLVTTTPAAGDIRNRLGSPAYSYYFAVEALAPVLESLGAWRLIDRPESRLAFAAARAEADGFRPIHLAINPLQDCYFCPGLPNVVFPFWEFPQIPDRDLGDDARQNWVRLCRGASLILTACEFTAAAFRNARIAAPVAVVPVPLAPQAFDLGDWRADDRWTLSCRHEILDNAGGDRAPVGATEAPRSPVRGRGIARALFRRVSPWLRPETVERLQRVARLGRSSNPQPAPKGLILGLRRAYRTHIRPLLSDSAVARVTSAKESALRLLGRRPNEGLDPLLPASELTLGGGLVYLSIFGVGDPRKNWRDLLSAFLLAFRDRADVTLAIKLVTSPRCEFHEVGLLRSAYEAMGIVHLCRVAVIVEFLDESQMTDLFRVATYYVNTSHAEGACLPLMRALAGGRPAIAPDHTAMTDYVDSSVAFVPRSHPEPTCWPHDPEKRLDTSRYRLVWSDLCDHLRRSAEVAEREPAIYREMASAARRRMRSYADRDQVAEALRNALKLLDDEAGLAASA